MALFRFHGSTLFRVDNLSWVMVGLILFVIANVVAYSSRYLAGDRNRRWHLGGILLLAVCMVVMVLANHLLILLMAWAASNLLLVRLMIHKSRWIAAKNAGMLALRTFALGFSCLFLGFFLLAQSAGTASISVIVQQHGPATLLGVEGLFLVAVAAIIHSAAWPFQRWLLSSLNSPTPVSALMHAGIVNAGGFFLVRFAPLYATSPMLLHGLFLVGLITAVSGSFWKLIQTDVKRMLACSTMGQMGFMLMQCGMGLFAPAISHLCWHALFKAYLFLSAGSVIHENRAPARFNVITRLTLPIAGLAGVCGSITFSLTSGNGFSCDNTQCLMMLIAFMVAAQLATGLLNSPVTIPRVAGILLVGLASGACYGVSIRLVETALASLHANRPQTMDPIYMIGLGVIFLSWMATLLNLPARLERFTSWKRLYMAALNASQPHPQTITATRTAYQYRKEDS